MQSPNLEGMGKGDVIAFMNYDAVLSPGHYVCFRQEHGDIGDNLHLFPWQSLRELNGSTAFSKQVKILQNSTQWLVLMYFPLK